MTLLRNLLAFFVVFLPAACGTGLVGGFLEGPVPAPRFAYDVFVFEARVLPLMIPSLLAVPLLHFAIRWWARDASHHRARTVAIVATPIALLAVHLAFFQLAYWSVALVVLFLVPGVAFGACFGIVRPRAATARAR